MNKVILRYCLAVLVLVITLPVSAKTTLKIKGLKGSLENNVEAYVSAIPKQDYSTSLRFQMQLEQEIRDALKALGRYNPTISFTDVADGKDHQLIAKVKAGPKTVITRSDIVITGMAKDDPDFIALIRNSGLGVGNTLNHGKYETLKSSLSSLALRKGYFDAELKVSKLEVAPSRNEAFIILEYASGQRYNFGKTSFEGSQIELDRLESLIPYKEGDPYLVSSLGEFNQRLSNVGWFASIFVGGDSAHLKDGSIPIGVAVTPQVKNQVETGIGYSTDVGMRLKLNWRKPWLNSAGHSLRVNTEISKIQPKIEAIYKIPLEDVLNNYYQVIGGIRYVDNHDTVSTEYSLGLERHWRLESSWKRVVSLRLLYENYTQGKEESGVLHMVVPGISYDRIRLRGGAMPTWGDSQLISVEFSDPTLGSDSKLARLRGRTAWIRSMGENQRGILRLDGGAVFADRLEDIPPSMRFFIGGDNSLRGYSYQSIAPRNDKGLLMGGKYMATSSLEYQYRVHGNWWGAVFYDYGSAWNDSPDWLAGTGVGVRWASPVGPIRLDFAWGLDKKRDKFQIHFILGPEI